MSASRLPRSALKKPFARKRFGQHFLTDQTVIRSLLESFAPKATETIIEIGPGRGALTFPLLEKIPSLYVIEIDRDLAALLREKKARLQEGGSLSIIQEDVLKIQWEAFCTEHGLQPPLRLIGNLPYNISTPFLFSLLPIRAQLQDAYFMLQKEVVDRMVAQPHTPEYGRLSVMIQYYFEVQARISVPPGAFNPPPLVHSAIVRLQPRARVPSAENEALLAAIVLAAFSQRRKMLKSALSPFEISPMIYATAEIDPQRRAESLSVSEYIQLSNLLQKARSAE